MAGLTTDAALLDTVGAFYAALEDPAGWAVAVEKLRVLCGAEAANFGVFDPTSPTPVISANQGAWTDQAMAEYVADFLPIDPAPARFARMPTEVPASTEAFFSPEHNRRSVVYNEFLRPRGLTQCVGGRLLDIPRGISIVSIHRSLESRPFSPAEVACLAQALPHIARAFQLKRMLDRQRLQMAGLGAAIDQLEVGLIALDGELTVLHVNAAAREIAARTDGLRLTAAGHLRAVDATAAARLSALQAEVLAGGAGGLVAVPRRPADHGYAVLVSPLPQGAMGAMGEPRRPGVLIAVSDPDRRTPSAATLLASAFGLTPRGADLALALANGEDLRAYADRQGVSMNTCRFQLKAVFARMGVHSQSELVRLAVRTLADLNPP